MTDKMQNQLFNWGLSMYGGYYANYWSGSDGHYTGIHADSYRELKERAESLGMKLDKGRRSDN